MVISAQFWLISGFLVDLRSTQIDFRCGMVCNGLMDLNGSGRIWMDLDGSGWIWMDLLDLDGWMDG